MPDSVTALIGRVDLWIGIGRGIINLALIWFMYLVVMAILGRPKPWWKWPTGSSEADIPQRTHATHGVTATPRAAPTARHELHLEIIDNLKQSRQLQGATIVLVVFTVLILAIDGVLPGSETATILAGITGYVLGARPNARDHQPDGADSAGSGNGAAPADEVSTGAESKTG